MRGGWTLKADRFLKSYFQRALWRTLCAKSVDLAYYKLAELSRVNTPAHHLVPAIVTHKLKGHLLILNLSHDLEI